MSRIITKFDCSEKNIVRRFLLPCQASAFSKPLMEAFFNLNLKCKVEADHPVQIKIECETSGVRLLNSANIKQAVGLYDVVDGECVIDSVSIIREDMIDGPRQAKIKLNCVLVTSFEHVVGEPIVVTVEDSNIQANGVPEEYQPAKIFSYSPTTGSILGGDEIILITSNLDSDLVGIQFYEMDKDGKECWCETIRLSQSQLVFKTSLTIQTVPYRGPTLGNSVCVLFRLVACPNSNTLIFSDPHPFYYKRLQILVNSPTKRTAATSPVYESKKVRVEDENKILIKKEYALESEVKPITTADADTQTDSCVNFERKESYSLQEFAQLVNVLSKKDQMMNSLCHRTVKAVTKLARYRDLGALIKVHRKLLCYIDEDTGNTAIHECIENKNLDILKTFVEAVQTIPEDGILEIKNIRGESPLLLACIVNEPVVVEYLFEAGASFDSKNHYGQTILHLAFKIGKVEMIRTVLKYACKPILSCMDTCHARPEQKYRGYLAMNSCDHDGYAPVHYACRNWTLLTMLLEVAEMVNWNITSKTRGYAPLHYIAESKNSCAADFCLKVAKMKNIQIDICTCAGFTPLYLAIMNNNYRSIICLLNYGANVNINSQTMGVFNGQDWAPLEMEEKWKSALENLVTSVADLYMSAEKWSREVVGYVMNNDRKVKLVHYDNILEYASKDPWVSFFFLLL